MQFMFYGRPKAETIANMPADLMDKVHGDQAMARDLYGRGIFRQLWMSGYGAIVLGEAESREQFDAIIAELPLAKAGYIDVDVFELTPYAGFTGTGKHHTA